MTKAQTLTLLACQIDIPAMTTRTERDAHLQVMAEKVTVRLAETSETVDLVVLPELSSIDYARKTFEQLDTLSEPLDGPSFNTWRAVAKRFGLHVCFGFPRQSDTGHRISMGVVGPDGRLTGYYDKLHLAQYGASMEKEYFQRGDSIFVFEIKGFRLAPIICYDIRIPELCRTLTLQNSVDAILHCGAYFRDESFASWHAFVTTRALENQVFFLSLNRAGENYGASLFSQPWQDETIQPVRFVAHAEEFRMITLDRATLTHARQTYSFLKDRLSNYAL